MIDERDKGRAEKLAEFDANDPWLLWKGVTSSGEVVRLYRQPYNIAIKVARSASDDGFVKMWEYAGAGAELCARIGAAHYMRGLEPKGWVRSIDCTREIFIVRARGTG